jgi:membrane-associated phospholipid phosphatase
VIVLVLAVLATAAGFVRPLVADTPPKLSATDRIKASPPPTLFSGSQTTAISTDIASQDKTATTLMASWWKARGTAPDDKTFLVWVETQVPKPPSSAVRQRELRAVQALDKQRTPAGVAAATWLEAHGTKDIWKLYLHDQRELEPAATGKTDKKELKLILSMAKTAADDLGTKYQQSAPYVLDPSLRTDHTVKKGAVCPCSYPSRHAARAAAARTYLGQLESHRIADYRWMEGQITYSRLYMAGHVASDITAGSLLGDMIGQYVLVTRGHEGATD